MTRPSSRGIVVFMVLLALAGSGVAGAQVGALSIDIRQLVPYLSTGRFVSLVAVVENAGPELRGELVARLIPRGNLPSQEIPLKIPVTLPPKSRLQFPLSIPVYGWLNSLEVEVSLRQGRRLIQKQAILIQSHNGVVALFFSQRQRGGDLSRLSLSGLNNSTIRGTMAVIQADPAFLPTDWRLLQGVTLVVFDDFPMERLTPEAEEAIVQWVVRGGHVILFPDTLRQRDASQLLQRLVPPQALPMSSSPVPPTTGLYERRPFGRGNVILVRPDAASTLWTGPGKEATWLGLIQGTSTDTPHPQSLVHRDMRRVSRHDFPYLLLFFSLYILLVGPGQYLYLKSRQQLDLLLGGTAVCSLSFFLIFFLIAAIRTGGRSTLLEYSVLMAPSGESRAGVLAFATYFSSKQQAYSFRSPLPSSLLQIAAPQNTYPRSSRLPREAAMTPGYTLEEFPIPMWGQERFVVDATISLPGPITVTREGQTLKIDNRSGLILRDCHYHADGITYYLTDTLRGEKREFALVPPPGQAPTSSAWRTRTHAWKVEGDDPLYGARNEIDRTVTTLTSSLPTAAHLIARLSPSPPTFDLLSGRPTVHREGLLVVHHHD